MKKKLVLILSGLILIFLILAMDLMNDHEILDNIIDRKQTKEATYSNVWIIANDGDKIEAFVDGEKQEYKLKYPLSEDVSNVIGDINVK